MDTEPVIFTLDFDSPLGAVTIAATSRGLVALSAGADSCGTGRAVLARCAARVHAAGTFAEVAPSDEHRAAMSILSQARRELDAYFRDPRQRFTVPLDPAGTPFQHRVWSALCTIAPGITRSYGALARELGNPDAARAVGAACGRNPIGIIIPCHRLIASNGSLQGYAGGLSMKQRLLAHEGTCLIGA